MSVFAACDFCGINPDAPVCDHCGAEHVSSSFVIMEPAFVSEARPGFRAYYNIKVRPETRRIYIDSGDSMFTVSLHHKTPLPFIVYDIGYICLCNPALDPYREELHLVVASRSDPVNFYCHNSGDKFFLTAFVEELEPDLLNQVESIVSARGNVGDATMIKIPIGEGDNATEIVNCTCSDRAYLPDGAKRVCFLLKGRPNACESWTNATLENYVQKYVPEGSLF